MKVKLSTELIDPSVGWLGKIPNHWKIVPAKSLFFVRNTKALPEDVHLTPSQKYGVLPQVEYMKITGSRVVLNLSDSGQMKHVEPGDFVSHLRSFQGGIELSRISGKVSGAYTVLTPKPDQYPGFWKYALKSDTYVQALQTTTDQLRDGQSIRMREFSLIPLPLIPLDEQKAIADFLDRELAQIDTLIEKQGALVEVLIERRHSFITEIVTGLSDSSMFRDSGIQWLGKAPKDWKVSPLKHNTYIKARVGWKGLTSDEFQEEAYAYLVTGQDFSRRTINLADCYQVDQKRYEDDPFIQLKKGDLLVTKDGSIGKLALVRELDKPACLNSGVFLVRPTKDYTTEFLYWVLSSSIFKNFINITSYGSTIQHLYQNVFKTFSFAFPTIKRQNEICSVISEGTQEIDALIDKAILTIQRLKERRQSLITAAVTGKIDVQKVA